jgi:hypothetical protein
MSWRSRFIAWLCGTPRSTPVSTYTMCGDPRRDRNAILASPEYATLLRKATEMSEREEMTKLLRECLWYLPQDFELTRRISTYLGGHRE